MERNAAIEYEYIKFLKRKECDPRLMPAAIEEATWQAFVAGYKVAQQQYKPSKVRKQSVTKMGS